MAPTLPLLLLGLNIASPGDQMAGVRRDPTAPGATIPENFGRMAGAPHLRDPPVTAPLPGRVVAVAALLLQVVEDVNEIDVVAVVLEPRRAAPELSCSSLPRFAFGCDERIGGTASGRAPPMPAASVGGAIRSGVWSRLAGAHPHRALSTRPIGQTMTRRRDRMSGFPRSRAMSSTCLGIARGYRAERIGAADLLHLPAVCA